MKVHPPTAAVRESFGQAQQQAAAMAGPAAPWDAAASAHRRPPRWAAVAVASVVAGGVTGWLGIDWWSGSGRVGSGGAPGTNARVDPPAPVQATSEPAVAPMAAAPPSFGVTRRSGVIRIASTNASLADVVRALAQATRTNVRGGEALAAISTPITLHWQGNDTAAAWEALLGRFASIAVSCGNAACELWIVGATAPRTASGATVSGSIAAGEQAPPPLPVVRQETPPPPSSEENTETN